MKQLLLVFLTINFLSPVKAQSWCMPGARWYYSAFSSLASTDAAVEYRYLGDTAILNKTVNIIKGKFSGHSYSQTKDTTIDNYRKYFIYEENDVLYTFNGTSFDTVVDFNASVGATWRTLPLCSVRHTYTVTSTGTATYYSVNTRTLLATYSFTYTNLSNVVSTATVQNIFIKNFSLSGNWNDFLPTRCPVSPVIPYDGPFEYFCGYTDNNTALQMSNSSGCRLINGIGELNKANDLLKMLPNPASSHVSLELNAASEIALYNQTGTLVYLENFPTAGKYSIEVAHLSPGLYYLRSRNKNAVYTAKLVKE